jgi:lysyl-tRNA synthetase class II
MLEFYQAYSDYQELMAHDRGDAVAPCARGDRHDEVASASTTISLAPPYGGCRCAKGRASGRGARLGAR